MSLLLYYPTFYAAKVSQRVGNIGSLFWFATVFLEKRNFQVAFLLPVFLIIIAMLTLFLGGKWYGTSQSAICMIICTILTEAQSKYPTKGTSSQKQLRFSCALQGTDSKWHMQTRTTYSSIAARLCRGTIN